MQNWIPYSVLQHPITRNLTSCFAFYLKHHHPNTTGHSAHRSTNKLKSATKSHMTGCAKHFTRSHFPGKVPRNAIRNVPLHAEVEDTHKDQCVRLWLHNNENEPSKWYSILLSMPRWQQSSNNNVWPTVGSFSPHPNRRVRGCHLKGEYYTFWGQFYERSLYTNRWHALLMVANRMCHAMSPKSTRITQSWSGRCGYGDHCAGNENWFCVQEPSEYILERPNWGKGDIC